MIRALLLSVLIWFTAATAQAHEVRPAYLKLTETAESEFTVVWKQPQLENRRLKINPVFPESCEETSEHGLENYGDTVIERWAIACPLTSGTLTLEGLERTLTDAFVDIDYLTREDIRAVLKPSQFSLNLAEAPTSAAGSYLKIGIEHVLAGWDHLLFILGLVLLVRPRQVIGVATSFTVAHSLTLAITALGFVSVPSRPVEILIAASIVFLAIEVIRKHRGEPSIAARKPWLIAFAIGLIHGFGFAGALADIGLPKGQELFALFLFNVGVELGQIIAIIAALCILWAVGNITKPGRRFMETLATYCIGAIGMFWVIERLSEYAA